MPVPRAAGLPRSLWNRSISMARFWASASGSDGDFWLNFEKLLATS